MSTRQRVSSGVRWESEVGYSRAVRVASHIFVSGSTATKSDGSIEGVGDEYTQAKYALGVIIQALTELGGSAHDVVRTRLFVTNIANWEAVGRAHGEVFGAIRPATSMVQVAALIHPDMLVEIEADAFVED
ncbi:MAG: RidA family protein [Phycisphaerae bacterium]|nr:RidA family protein [Gemmatimonadaceae bacterium]